MLKTIFFQSRAMKTVFLNKDGIITFNIISERRRSREKEIDIFCMRDMSPVELIKLPIMQKQKYVYSIFNMSLHRQVRFVPLSVFSNTLSLSSVHACPKKNRLGSGSKLVHTSAPVCIDLNNKEIIDVIETHTQLVVSIICFSFLFVRFCTVEYVPTSKSFLFVMS